MRLSVYQMTSEMNSLVQQLKSIARLHTNYAEKRQTVGLQTLKSMAPEQAKALVTNAVLALLAAAPEARGTVIEMAMLELLVDL